MPDPPRQPDATVAWNKVQVYLDKLFDSLQELEEGGGVVEAAKLAGWKASRIDKAGASLKATRDAIDGELARMKIGRRLPLSNRP